MTGFDISEQGIEKARRLADHNQVNLRLFRADMSDYFPEEEFDIIFCSGTLHFLSPKERKD